MQISVISLVWYCLVLSVFLIIYHWKYGRKRLACLMTKNFQFLMTGQGEGSSYEIESISYEWKHCHWRWRPRSTIWFYHWLALLSCFKNEGDGLTEEQFLKLFSSLNTNMCTCTCTLTCICKHTHTQTHTCISHKNTHIKINQTKLYSHSCFSTIIACPLKKKIGT